jgi:hypothetical protein
MVHIIEFEHNSHYKIRTWSIVRILDGDHNQLVDGGQFLLATGETVQFFWI